MKVNIYIGKKWIGNFRGDGKAIAIIEYIDKTGYIHEKEVEERIVDGSLNELDVKICVAALRTLKKKCSVTIKIDSNYVKSAIKNGWVENWAVTDWKRKDGMPVANDKYWRLFKMMMDLHEIEIEPYDKKRHEDLQEALNRKEIIRWRDIEKMFEG